MKEELLIKIYFCFFDVIYSESRTFLFSHLFLGDNKANVTKRSPLITFLYLLNLFIQILLHTLCSPVAEDKIHRNPERNFAFSAWTKLNCIKTI